MIKNNNITIPRIFCQHNGKHYLEYSAIHKNNYKTYQIKEDLEKNCLERYE